MMRGLWGKKIGMTQMFSEDKKLIPVTAIDISNWCITQIKTEEKDGYNAVQLGFIRKKYSDQEFSSDWLKNKNKYFSILREVKIDKPEDFKEGKISDISDILKEGDIIDVFGITKGAGFQGAVKRHGFAGGKASHGAVFGRFPGALSFMRRQGKVPKGKKMPGHMGVDRRVMKNLKIIKIEPDASVLLVAGSVPGKSGSLVFVKKSITG